MSHRPGVRKTMQRIDRRLFRAPVDPARAWRGTGAAGQPGLRIQRFGGCEFREMPLSHTVASHVGYPKYLASTIADCSGVSVEFSDHYVGALETLPTSRASLVEHSKLTGPPDLVILQLGSCYSYKVVLGAGRRRGVLRDRAGRAAGRHVASAYRLMNPVYRRGRLAYDYPGFDGLGAFAELIRQQWPLARILVLGLQPALDDGSFDRAMQARLSQDQLAAAARLGLDHLSLEDVVPAERCHYAANGAQLSPSGSRLVAAKLWKWMLEAGIAQPQEAVEGGSLHRLPA